jgi:hypothetical protein
MFSEQEFVRVKVEEEEQFNMAVESTFNILLLILNPSDWVKLHPGVIVTFKGRDVEYRQSIEPVRYNPGVPTTAIAVPLPETVPFDAVNPAPTIVVTAPP